MRHAKLTKGGHLSAKGTINTKRDVWKVAQRKGLPPSIVPSEWGPSGHKQGRGKKRR